MAELIAFEKEEFDNLATIKVIGIGGGGGNAVKRMIEANLRGVEFYVINTDMQALRLCHNAERIAIGSQTTGGLGAGSDPEKGRKAAEEDEQQLQTMVSGADMVFVTAGLGGGTGTGAAPVVARLAKQTGALTIAVVTRPFDFEGPKRKKQAEEGLEELRDHADAIIVIPNERLNDECERATPIRMAFRMADEVLLQGVQSISDLITIAGEINLDFADVKTIMAEAGGALMGIGAGSGDNRAQTAAKNAISCPLLEETSIEGATGVLVNITGDLDMTLYEVREAMDIIYEATSQNANVIFGLVYDEQLEDEIRVTVIATGFDHTRQGARRSVGGAETIDLEFLLKRDFDPDAAQGGRRRAEGTQEIPRRASELSSHAVEDALDIPTFLRVNRTKRK